MPIFNKAITANPYKLYGGVTDGGRIFNSGTTTPYVSQQQQILTTGIDPTLFENKSTGRFNDYTYYTA